MYSVSANFDQNAQRAVSSLVENSRAITAVVAEEDYIIGKLLLGTVVGGALPVTSRSRLSLCLARDVNLLAHIRPGLRGARLSGLLDRFSSGGGVGSSRSLRRRHIATAAALP